MRFVDNVPLKFKNSIEYDRDDSYVCSCQIRFPINEASKRHFDLTT